MTLPTNIQKPKLAKFPGVTWFCGLDPAVKVDNFGVVVHGLMPKPPGGTAWIPFIREVFEIDHDNFTDVIQWITNVLFRYYPPRYGIIDATRDTPMSQELERKYGDQRIKALSMTNKLNYEMKQTGWTFLEQGYIWPNTVMMKDKEKARAIAELQQQCLHERVEYTMTDQLKFSHPPGKHNDLNRAWEMSLKAVKDYQLGKVGDITSDLYKDYPTEEVVDYREPSGSFALPSESDYIEDGRFDL